MKTLLLLLSSYVFLFAATPQEREAKLSSVVDINISNTQRIEKRISKINAALKIKAQERIEKNKLREARLKKLDKMLQLKAKARETSSK